MRESDRRNAVVRACMARFDGKPLDLAARRDCVRLGGHSMRLLGVSTPLLKGLDYRSEIGAARALKRLGFADLIEAMDGTGMARIPVAMTWPGDIVAGRSRDDGPFRFALSVVHTPGAARTLAFGPTPEGIVCGVGSPDLTHPDLVAWRIA